AKLTLDLGNAFGLAVATDATFVAGSAVAMSGLSMANANATGTMFMSFTDANLTLTDVTLKNGVTTGLAGALRVAAPSPGTLTPTVTLNNCTLSGNTSNPTGSGTFYGGTMYSRYCDVSLTGCTFTKNNM